MGQRVRRVIGGAAIAFGALTVVSGFSVLLGGDDVAAMAGQVVTGILWFNAISGFLYIAAGLCVFRNGRYGRALATGLALALAFAFAGLGWHIAQGGGYELRTVAAMTLRLGFWTAISVWLWTDYEANAD